MSWFRPDIDEIAGYTPGEQPRDAGWIKLNTNENPYPPSPRVAEAINEAARGRLNLYPDPLGTAFRFAAASVLGVDPEWILPGNGSDEVLTILTRSFVDKDDLVAYPYPSYILYETLAALQGSRHARLLLKPDWSWDWSAIQPIWQATKLLFIPNPNSPSGTCWSNDDLERLIPERGVLVLDQAYGDFADQPDHGALWKRPAGDRVILTRTFSKSYSLAGIRFGFAMAHPDLIRGLRKVKDSYNCDSLSLAAATAAMLDQEWMHANLDRVRTTRTRLENALAALGFQVTPSQANFVWTTHPTRSHRELYEALKQRRILVRYMRFPDVTWAPDGVCDGLRITVGTDDEITTFLQHLREIMTA